ncbi:MAG: hypothetical protein QG626_117 [Patescibacteria group bacterium]|jgi:hypothetical protein|nr:hypothetical protein [Patescibacteria group bacterium]
MDSQPQHPNQRYGLITGLLFCLLLVSIADAAILIASKKTAPNTNTMAEACTSQVQSAVLDATREITRSCQSNQTEVPAFPTMGSMPALDGQLGFEYPLGWSAASTTSRTDSPMWDASLVPGYFAYCDGCDGPIIDILMHVGEISSLEPLATTDFNAYLAKLYSTENGYSAVAISPTKDVGGERYTITGMIDGMYSGPFETIYFTGKTKYASITFLDKDETNNDTNIDWERIKDSLDFSGIQQ